MSLDWAEGAWQRSSPWRIGQVTLLHLCRLLRSPPIEVTFVKAQARGTLDQKGRPCQASPFQQGSWTVVPLICASPSPRLCSLFSHLNVEQKNKVGFERAGRAFLRGRPYFCREKADNQEPSSRPGGPRRHLPCGSLPGHSLLLSWLVSLQLGSPVGAGPSAAAS